MSLFYSGDAALIRGEGTVRNAWSKDVINTPYTLPPVSAEIVKEINDSYKNYIFVNKVAKNDILTEYYCTKCGNSAPEKKVEWARSGGRTVTYEDSELASAKHNDKVACPVCKCYGEVKRMARLRNYRNYSEWRSFIVFQQAGPNEVFIRLLSSRRERSEDMRARTHYVEWEFYHLTPGRCEFWHYGYGGWRRLSDERVLKCNISGCKILGVNDLKGSFLQYSVTEDYIKRFCDPVCAACFAALYPCTEMLFKFGFHGIISEWLDRRKKNAYCIYLKAKDFDTLFKLPKATADYLMEQSRKDKRVKEYICDVFAGIKLFGKDIEGCKLAIEWCDVYSFWSCQPLLTEVFRSLYGAGPKVRSLLVPLIRYIYRKKDKSFFSFEGVLRYYRDYLNEGSYIDLDFNDEVVRFPKDLRASHDNAVEIANGMRNAEQTRAMTALYKKHTEKYGFEELGYVVIAPKNTAEIVSEGQMMHHCVGGYADRHAEGKLAILFIRKVEAIAEPYATVEVHGSEVRQVQGKGNKPTWENEADKGKSFNQFLADWKKYIKRKQKPLVEAVAG